MRTRISPELDFLDLESFLTSEQKLMRDSVRQVVKAEIEPVIANSYEQGQFPVKVIQSVASVGILGANLSGYGLPGLDAVTYGLGLKELERCDSAIRSFASVQGALVMYPIHAFGSEEQKQRWLPQLASGEVIGCFGLTEEQGGSDPGAMRTKAVRKGSKWILNGSKMWITNGNIAEISIVWAQTEDGVRGFIVPLKSKGCTVKEMHGKLSLRASITSELYFDEVELSEDTMLPAAKGLKAALSCLTQARFGIAWGVIGAAEACFEEALGFASQRMSFNKPIAHKQLVQVKLARMLSRITQAQLLAHRLATLKDEGKLQFTQVSLGKQNNVEMALEVARSCRDILGANGIMLEYKTMRHMCNLETVFTYEGTNDVHLLILGSEITGVATF